METNKRWLKSVLRAAEQTDVQMPWARGARRQEMIDRRNFPVQLDEVMSA